MESGGSDEEWPGDVFEGFGDDKEDEGDGGNGAAGTVTAEDGNLGLKRQESNQLELITKVQAEEGVLQKRDKEQETSASRAG